MTNNLCDICGLPLEGVHWNRRAHPGECKREKHRRRINAQAKKERDELKIIQEQVFKQSAQYRRCLTPEGVPIGLDPDYVALKLAGKINIPKRDPRDISLEPRKYHE